MKLERARYKVERDISEEIDLLDTMLSSLVDVLIEKGIITVSEDSESYKEITNKY